MFKFFKRKRYRLIEEYLNLFFKEEPEPSASSPITADFTATSQPSEYGSFAAPEQEQQASPLGSAPSETSAYGGWRVDYDSVAASAPPQNYACRSAAPACNASAPRKAATFSPKLKPKSKPKSKPKQRESLEDLLAHLDEPFSATLMHLIDQRGMSDPQVYKRANISRQHFSKMRSNPDYQPTKRTVLALCVALRLNLGETELLLERAGFALSSSSKVDLIVRYFIERKEYDILAINDALYHFDQPILC